MALTEGQKWYREYLNSDHWKELKERKKKKGVRKTCPGCTRHINNLQLHHLLYRSDPKESELLDLAWLCGDCHKIFHEAFGTQLPAYYRRNRPWLRAFTKKAIRVELFRRGQWPQPGQPKCMSDWKFMQLYRSLRKEPNANKERAQALIPSRLGRDQPPHKVR